MTTTIQNMKLTTVFILVSTASLASASTQYCYDQEKCESCDYYQDGSVNWLSPEICPHCDLNAPDCPTPPPTPPPTPGQYCYDQEKCESCDYYMVGGVNWSSPEICPYCDINAPDCPLESKYQQCTSEVTWCSNGGNLPATTNCMPCCNNNFWKQRQKNKCQQACKATYMDTCNGEWDNNWARFLTRSGETVPRPNFL